MNIKKLFTVIYFFIALGISSCGNKDQEAQKIEEHAEELNGVEISEAQYNAANIQLGSITKRQMSGLLKVNGLLDVPPQQQVSISLPYGGILAHTELLQGMWVNKGQVIATVEHPDYIELQQDYFNAKQEMQFMEKEYERQKELSRENISAEKVLQKTASEYRSAELKVEAFKQKLSLINISSKTLEEGIIVKSIPVISPISGYVTDVNANIGKYVQPNEVLFEIVDTRHLHAELTVFEKDIPQLKVDQKVRFVLTIENSERTASIHLIGRKISEERTVRVHAHLDKEDKQLIPNTYFKAIIETGSAMVPTLPDNAIVQFEGKNYIFVFKERRIEREIKIIDFEMKEVQTGLSDMGYTEVTVPNDVSVNTKNIVFNGAYVLLSLKNSGGEDGHH